MRSLVLGLLLGLSFGASAKEPLPKCTPDDGPTLVVSFPSRIDTSTYIVPVSAAKFRTEVQVLHQNPNGGVGAVPYQVTVTIVNGVVRAESSSGDRWEGTVSGCGMRSPNGPKFVTWDSGSGDTYATTRAQDLCVALINLGLTPTILE